MKDKNKTVCFSGHRTNKLPRNKIELTCLVENLYEQIDKTIFEGFDTFLFGACYGFDLMCAEQVLLRKKVIRYTDPHKINLVGVAPFEEQPSKWNQHDRNIYYNILSKCDDVITLKKQYEPGCYHERNRYMIDNSSKLICYFNGSSGGTKYTVEYAETLSVPIINLYNIIKTKNVDNDL